MTQKARRRRTELPVAAKPNVDEEAVQTGVYAVLAAGALMAVVTGSLLPVIGTAAAVGMAAWYVRNGPGKWLK
jgi:hypothetical protein